MTHAMSEALTAPLAAAPLVARSDSGHFAGDPTTELIAVGLLMLFFWGLYRVTANKAPPQR
jgi:hypothetical protein